MEPKQLITTKIRHARHRISMAITEELINLTPKEGVLFIEELIDLVGQLSKNATPEVLETVKARLNMK